MYDNNVKLLIDALASVALAAIPIVGAYVVAFLKRHLSAAQLATGLSIGHIVVKATEQVAGATNVAGSQKYAIALGHAKDLAKHLGIDFSDDQWRGIIEQAVHELNADFYAPLVAADAPVLPNSAPPGSLFVSGVQTSPNLTATAPLATTSIVGNLT